MRRTMWSCSEGYVRSCYLGHWALIAGALALFAACGSDDDDNDDVASGGSAGSASTATGGKATGGQSNTGGKATGGASTGGAPGAAGVEQGGTAPEAGASTGGVPGAAGVEQGGTAPETGGSGTGGGSAAAGAGAGGMPSAGAGPIAEAGQGGTGVTPPTPLMLYVACADTTGSIQQYALDREAWAVTPVGTYTTGVSNSWATLNAAQDRMYVCSRTEGRITTLSRDTTTGALTVLGNPVSVPMQPPGVGGEGGAPAVTNPATQVVALDPSEQYLLAANFNANYVYVYDLAGNRTVRSLVDSANDGLQSHQVVFVPGSRRGSVLVPYRGSDLIATYRFDASDGSLTLARTEPVDDDDTDATTGPRHLVVHPTWHEGVYVLNEVAGTIDLFLYDDANGTLTPQSTVSSVPPDYTSADKFASEIAVAPSGDFVYVSNRYGTAAGVTTEGSLGVFAVDVESGELSAIEFEGSRGALPRHFMLSSDGKVLVVGNQNSNNIAVFSVDTQSGELTHQFTRDVCGTPFFVQLIGD
ncbi:MAG: beta-propeller fold lactonase family protein [Polyangiaceae bacterium]|nr:beta-propeller fold lactonase family protein [Polyangiaceae bacterium]